MSGIAGIHEGKSEALVKSMLDTLRHRGPDARAVKADDRGTLGGATLAVGPNAAAGPLSRDGRMIAWDGELYNFDELQGTLGEPVATDVELLLGLYEREGPGFMGRLNGPFALAVLDGNELILARDFMGQAPLYWGYREGRLCFASEMKALQVATDDINVFPPGHCFRGGELRAFETNPGRFTMPEDPGEIAAGLRLRLERAVERRVAGTAPVGSWLSGGLDSATLAALTCQFRSLVPTFSAGVAGAPDLAFARKTAVFLGTVHHECLYDVDDMLRVLPLVIYHLESFDAPLVRSSVANYLVAGLAGQFVKVVLSGEGGDELFAGYSYLKTRPEEELPRALAEAQAALSTTALQRVDRMAGAHSTKARTCFLDPEVVTYANSIPGRWKIYGEEGIEKWILRMALEGSLPEEVRWRAKEKFWSGAGVTNKLEEVAEARITDEEFAREREVAPGFLLPSKEELFYFRIFRGHFPHPKALDCLGRTVHREGR